MSLFFRWRAGFKKTVSKQNTVQENLKTSRRNLCSEEKYLTHSSDDQIFASGSSTRDFKWSYKVFNFFFNGCAISATMQQVTERLETPGYFYDNRSCALGLSNTKIPIPAKDPNSPNLKSITCTSMTGPSKSGEIWT